MEVATCLATVWSVGGRTVRDYRFSWEKTMTLIKNFMMAGALASLATVAAGAAPISTCPTATMAVYVTVTNGVPFSCTIGDKTFSNFSYTPNAVDNTGGTGAQASDALHVTVMPFGNPAGPNWGFSFTGIWILTPMALPMLASATWWR